MDISKDNRFAHIIKDPRFKRLPKSERKVKIDKRFQSIFNDKRFQVKYSVDKRGRPVNQSSAENFRKYYDISSGDSDGSSEESEKDSEVEESGIISQKEIVLSKHSKKSKAPGKERNKVKLTDKLDSKSKENSKNLKNKLNSSWVVSESSVKTDNENFNDDEDSEAVSDSVEEEEEEVKGKDLSDEEAIEDDQVHRSRMTDDIKRKLRDLKVDYARGMGTLMTDSSSDEETSEEESDDDTLEHAWGELDADAEETEEATNRIAILHMDWDRIRAADLMVLCNSFLPSDGLIKSVAIYPSEFGIKRLKEEELKGPIELVEMSKESKVDEETTEEGKDEGSKYHMEKLRQYQLNRLKYYYAVVEFDSARTANKVYAECDGMEYESSSTKLDLRFIPDDVTFDHEPKEMITSLPDPSKYKPRYFTNTALQQGKVQLTWDETDPDRKEFTQKILTNADNVTDEDLQAYLAYSSGEEDEVDEKTNNIERDEENASSDSEDEKEEDKIAKYRALLASIESAEEKKKEQDVQMEITWGVGLKEKTQQLVDDKLKTPLTPFEALLEKKRQIKKMKKEERLKKQKGDDEDAASSENPYSDDDIPSDIDINDPYFKEELDKLPKPKKKNKKHIEEEDEDEKQRKAELELLLLEEGNEEKGKSHFSLKGIQDQENTSKKKRRRKLLKKKKKLPEENLQENDDFQVDVADDRFSALYSSHHYNIDPADPQFRKTKAMEAIIEEKIKRRKTEDNENVPDIPRKTTKLTPELNTLVKSVKNKMQRVPRT